MSEGQCERCGESVELCDLNIEAFEQSDGEILCGMCAEVMLRDLDEDEAALEGE